MKTITMAFFSTAMLMAADTVPTQPLSFTVHEWGTFTSVAAADGSAMDWDALGCKDDLPSFVIAHGYRGFKFSLQASVRMETPVLYFYSQREMEARVKIQFPHGVLTEWYPKADTEIYKSKAAVDRMVVQFGPHLYSADAVVPTRSLLNPPLDGLDSTLVKLGPNMNGMSTSPSDEMGSIEWRGIKIQPDTTPVLPWESEPSRYYAARQTDSSPVTVDSQQEKFLFYRGVAKLQVPLYASISTDGKIVIENRLPEEKRRAKDPVPNVFLFENHGGKLGYRNGGAIEGTVALDPAPLNGAVAALKFNLEAALVAQGLYLKEAEAMLETWKDSWFEEGSRLIYIVPASAVDSILPLQIDPAPSQTARVFVGRIELITPATKRAVEDAVTVGNWAALDRYSRFLEPILARISSENPGKADQIRRRIAFARPEGNCR